MQTGSEAVAARPTPLAGVRRGRLAFVAPRYGTDVVGGAEAVVREAAMGLSARGWDVEVVTTCALNHYTWKNELPEGTAVEDGLRVHRYQAVRELSNVGRRAQELIGSGGQPTFDEQVAWLGFQFRAPGVFSHLLEFGPGFDAVVFAPYLYWTTTAGIQAVPDRSVVIPCLHDEGFARLAVIRPVLASPRSVWFISEPEHELAHRLGPVAPHHLVTGSGVHPPRSSGRDPGLFRSRHRIAKPFVLFAGRREKGKGWNRLLEAFEGALDQGLDVDLVTLGVGDVIIPPRLAGRVVDLGFVPDEVRDEAMGAALAYVQPGRLESFSRTVMEAWLAGTPVIAWEDSEVVAWHCRRSGGGLLCSGAGFPQALRALLDSPERARQLGARGRQYVLDHYSWETVLDVMEGDLEVITRAPAAFS